MNYQNPKPRSRADLEAMLDARLSGMDVLKLLPNPSMADFSVRQESKRIARDLATVERLADGEHLD